MLFSAQLNSEQIIQIVAYGIPFTFIRVEQAPAAKLQHNCIFTTETAVHIVASPEALRLLHPAVPKAKFTINSREVVKHTDQRFNPYLS